MPRPLALLVLALLATAAVAAPARNSDRISCRIHVANNTGAPTTFGRASSSLQVLAAADISDVSVILQLAHPDMAALEVRARLNSWPVEGTRCSSASLRLLSRTRYHAACGRAPTDWRMPCSAAHAQVTLKATPPGSKLSKAVVLKAPAFGASGGANMVQTIFSDYAPAPFAVSAVRDARRTVLALCS